MGRALDKSDLPLVLRQLEMDLLRTSLFAINGGADGVRHLD